MGTWAIEWYELEVLAVAETSIASRVFDREDDTIVAHEIGAG